MRCALLILLLCVPVLALANRADSTHYADGTRIYSPDSLYQGLTVKLDVGNTALMAGLTRGKVITSEFAVNCRLKNRYYQVVEGGYAYAHDLQTAGGSYSGQGGFIRLGADLNGLKRNPESQNALLIGVRLGTSVQGYSLHGVTWNNPTDPVLHDYTNRFRGDCWGEVVVGAQVQIYGGLNMGWTVRAKVLFTRTTKDGNVLPYYLPGYGYRNNTSWGVNYYIGYKF